MPEESRGYGYEKCRIAVLLVFINWILGLLSVKGDDKLANLTEETEEAERFLSAEQAILEVLKDQGGKSDYSTLRIFCPGCRHTSFL
jgi:hypothetical protein